MTTDQARAFIAAVPWRQVKDVPVGEGLPDGGVERYGEHRHVKPDPHQYVIREWREVADNDFDRFVELIRQDGYHEMRNWYLEIDGWCYWFISPRMLNRERAEDRKHVPIP